jgi:WD40 repeat protein
MQTGSHPTYVLKERSIIPDVSSEVFSLRFNPEGNMIAAACTDSVIRVYHSASGRLVYSLSTAGTIAAPPGPAFPTTSIAFRPLNPAVKTKNILLSGNASGQVQHWHVTSGKCVHTITEADNEVYSVDYSRDGLLFATAGKDQTVRVYDENTRSKIADLTEGYGEITAGHSSRIYSVLFHPTDPNMLVSGSWDNTIQIWDRRARQSVRSIFGTNVSGDALDISGNTILTGSWRPDDALQLWDFRTTQLQRTIPWPIADKEQPTLLYCAKFGGSNSEFIAAGGSDGNQARVFERSTGEEIGRVQCDKAVFSTAFSSNGRFLAIGGASDDIQIVDVTAAPRSPVDVAAPSPEGEEDV